MLRHKPRSCELARKGKRGEDAKAGFPDSSCPRLLGTPNGFSPKGAKETAVSAAALRKALLRERLVAPQLYHIGYMTVYRRFLRYPVLRDGVGLSNSDNSGKVVLDWERSGDSRLQDVYNGGPITGEIVMADRNKISHSLVTASIVLLSGLFLSFFSASWAFAYQQTFVITNVFLHDPIIVALESNYGGEAQIQPMSLSAGPSNSCQTRPDGSWLIQAGGVACTLQSVNNIEGMWRVCADSLQIALRDRAPDGSALDGVNPSINCFDGKHTRVEISESSPGTNLDISVVPSGSNSGVFCNDPQWGNCPYNNADQTVYVASMGGNVWCSQLNPSQPEASQCTGGSTVSQDHCGGSGLKAAYNIGVTASCNTVTNSYNRVITLTCKGTPSLGTAGYPSNCGFTKLSSPPSANCIGDGGVSCYQAFFSPMSTGGNYTQNGKYYCGFTAPFQQPDITCASQTTPISIIFSDPRN